jgi:hypothetical protein
MVRNNHRELNKATLINWVDKALIQLLSKKNIKSNLKATKVWPFNPKAMDERTKPNYLYTLAPNTMGILNNDNDNLNDATNGNQLGGGAGT